MSSRKNGNWSPYAERLKNYLEANSIEDKTKKMAISLSLSGAEVYKFIRDLVA